MKNITEYNFRELVGQNVKMNFTDGRTFLDPDFEEYVAYGYVDLDAGMTFEVIGGYKDGKIYTDPTSSNKIRYSEDLELEPYDDPDEEMLGKAKFIEDNYTPEEILPFRSDERLDPYRDKVFPDDLLIPVNTITDGRRLHELLWVRPYTENQGMIMGMTIESGHIIKEHEVIAIVEISDFIEGRKFTFSAMTMDMIKAVCESDDPESFFR
jgi:hypothetical protein